MALLNLIPSCIFYPSSVLYTEHFTMINTVTSLSSLCPVPPFNYQHQNPVVRGIL